VVPAADDNQPARRVLVVDDDDAIRDLVTAALDFVGYEVRGVADGWAAVEEVRRFAPHLVVLDVMMPGLDGVEVCRRLRADGDTTPVIFLTARDTNADTLEGFRAGADDYLTKPFNLHVLAARIAAVLRRAAPPTPAVDGHLRYRGIELDEQAHRVRRDGQPVPLSPTEFRLLQHLLVNAERVLSKAQIVEHLWRYDFGGDTNIVETHMSSLRRKLGEPRLIQTVRGVGYVLRAE
jgi:two-component system OmpR family response regulator